MSSLLIALIRLYRALVPTAWRPRCIFRESCSLHVLNAARRGGFRAGLEALRRRYRQCRPGYARYDTPDGKTVFVLADGTVIPEDQLAT